MRASAFAMALIVALPLGACATNDGRSGYNHRGDRYDRDYSRDGNHARHHRRQLRDNDLIYRDRNGNYYCKRDDGTTGTIVGAIAGGVLGNVIAPGGSKTLGTIVGAVGGGIAGRAIDRNDVACE
jgi:outer membrane lipoprotein SlyB